MPALPCGATDFTGLVGLLPNGSPDSGLSQFLRSEREEDWLQAGPNGAFRSLGGHNGMAVGQPRGEIMGDKETFYRTEQRDFGQQGMHDSPLGGIFSGLATPTPDLLDLRGLGSSNSDLPPPMPQGFSPENGLKTFDNDPSLTELASFQDLCFSWEDLDLSGMTTNSIDTGQYLDNFISQGFPDSLTTRAMTPGILDTLMPSDASSASISGSYHLSLSRVSQEGVVRQKNSRNNTRSSAKSHASKKPTSGRDGLRCNLPLCPLPGKLWKRRELKRHKETVHDKKRLVRCPHCTKTTRNDNLKRHILTRHYSLFLDPSDLPGKQPTFPHIRSHEQVLSD